MILDTDYRDSVYSGNKKYAVTNNGDGTVSIEDKTTYTVDGDYYGCADINKENYQYNNLNVDYQIVNQLIAKIQSYGVTVSGNSPTAIINALNTLANNKYNAGRTNGRNAVISNPNAYGLYSSAQYQAQTGASTDYDRRIAAAKNYLNAFNASVMNHYKDLIESRIGFFNDGVNSIHANMDAMEAQWAWEAMIDPLGDIRAADEDGWLPTSRDAMRQALNQINV